MEPSNDPVVRFRNRVERRINFFKSMELARVGIYLPPDDSGRMQVMEALMRQIAKPYELSRLPKEVITEMARETLKVLETMQKHLPHDVQYRNRIRSRQSW